MYTKAALLDIHARTHHGLEKLLTHCRQLGADELDRSMEHFAYPTVRLQLHHALSAEVYWTGILQGRIEVDDNSADFPTVESLEMLRRVTFENTRSILESASDDELSRARSMMTWGNKEKTMLPAHVILRVLTHYFQHQGQVTAMLKILGKPAAGTDFLLD